MSTQPALLATQKPCALHAQTPQAAAPIRVTQSEARLELRLADVKAELRQEIAQVRVDLGALGSTLIKWMFAFWIGQAGLTIGLVLLVIGKR